MEAEDVMGLNNRSMGPLDFILALDMFSSPSKLPIMSFTPLSVLSGEDSASVWVMDVACWLVFISLPVSLPVLATSVCEAGVGVSAPPFSSQNSDQNPIPSPVSHSFISSA